MRCNGIISSEAVNSSLAWKFGIIVEEGGWNTILQAGVSPNHCQSPKDAGDSIGGHNDLKKSPCIICHGTCSTLSSHWHWLMMCFFYCRNLSLLCSFGNVYLSIPTTDHHSRRPGRQGRRHPDRYHRWGEPNHLLLDLESRSLYIVLCWSSWMSKTTS